jgi:hypothetical protein
MRLCATQGRRGPAARRRFATAENRRPMVVERPSGPRGRVQYPRRICRRRKARGQFAKAVPVLATCAFSLVIPDARTGPLGFPDNALPSRDLTGSLGPSWSREAGA